MTHVAIVDGTAGRAIPDQITVGVCDRLEADLHDARLRRVAGRAGSKVYIASMAGFDKYFRAATKDAQYPLVFVKTRAEAVYEVTGTTNEVPPGAEAVNGDLGTSQRDTTISVSNIESGQMVFTHSIRTTVTWPNRAAKVAPANRNPTPSRIVAIGKETAARQCAQALWNAINVKPTR